VRRTVFVALLLLLALPGAAKERYNVWAKEKIRYHHDRVNQDPYNAQLRVLLASAYYGDGRYHEAVAQLEKALDLEADYPEAHCNLGIVRQAQSMVADAEVHFREALRMDSTLVDAMVGLGTMLCTSGRRAEGILFLERTLARDAGRDDARFNLGVAYHKVGDYRRATEHLERLFERYPGYPGVGHGLSQAYFARGLTLLQAKMPVGALDFFRRSKELGKDAANVHYAEGLAHLRLEDLAAAEAAFATAVGLEEDHVPALHNLAHVLDLTDRPEDAEVYYRRVAQLTPHLDTIEAVRDATYDERILLQ
jgi:tetratricopeptide (TPR) repeat protein